MEIFVILFFLSFQVRQLLLLAFILWWLFQLAAAGRSARSFKRTALEVQMLRVKPCCFQDQARYARGGVIAVIMCHDWWLCHMLSDYQTLHSIRIPCEKERNIPPFSVILYLLMFVHEKHHTERLAWVQALPSTSLPSKAKVAKSRGHPDSQVIWPGYISSSPQKALRLSYELPATFQVSPPSLLAASLVPGY